MEKTEQLTIDNKSSLRQAMMDLDRIAGERKNVTITVEPSAPHTREIWENLVEAYKYDYKSKGLKLDYKLLK